MLDIWLNTIEKIKEESCYCHSIRYIYIFYIYTNIFLIQYPMVRKCVMALLFEPVVEYWMEERFTYRKAHMMMHFTTLVKL